MCLLASAFSRRPVILPRSGNKLIWKVAGRQAFIELPVLNVHSKMGTVCQPGQGLWDCEVLWVRLV